MENSWIAELVLAENNEFTVLKTLAVILCSQINIILSPWFFGLRRTCLLVEYR